MMIKNLILNVETELRQYLDIAGVIVLIIGNDGKIKYINKKGCQILGYKEEEIIGKNWFSNFISKDEEKKIKEFFKEIISGSIEPFKYFEYCVLTKSKEKRLIAWHNSFLKDKNGKIYATLSSGSDITKHKQALDALRESEGKYRALLRTSPNAIVVIDLDGMVTDASQRFLNLFGTNNLGDFLGKDAFEVLDPKDVKKAKENLRKTLKLGFTENLEYKFIRKDGKSFLGEVNASVIKNIYGKPKGVLATVRDVTKQKSYEKDLKEGCDKLQKAFDGVILAMAKIISTKDPYTSGHQQRVANLARDIAVNMGLSDEGIASVYTASMIHDIGKIFIPSEILSKPCKLNEAEFTIIKTHPKLSYDILEVIDLPWQIADIVLQHHERLNGSGYPAGLRDDEIMLEAKILSVADVVEAIAFHRPYRLALGIEKSIEEIENNKGILYDPEVVNVCVKIISKKGYKFDK
ncbi:MAG: PAS domain S-box protein [Endomicrobiales bacterium]|nr:PAS domain S-box protein [Endomicrobiales bacterium]